MTIRPDLLTIVGLALLAAPAVGQSWEMAPTGKAGAARANVCSEGDGAKAGSACFSLGCSETDPLHFGLDVAGGAAPGNLPVAIRVDDAAAGALSFVRREGGDGAAFAAPFDPRRHRALVGALRKGLDATLEFDLPGRAQVVEMPLKGSSRALGAVLEACPMPDIPLHDPAALTLEQITGKCAALGGTVTAEPGFERREDLDGDGRADVVIDYAAATCSQAASLYCGPGGCMTGFFLARGDAYTRLYHGVIRGYTVGPGGQLALELHGSGCGLDGSEACRKVFDIADGNLALVEEQAGTAAKTAMANARDFTAGGRVVAGAEAQAGGPTPPTASSASAMDFDWLGGSMTPVLPGNEALSARDPASGR